MYERLREYCKQTVPLSDAELGLIDTHFTVKTLKNKEFLLQDNTVCNFIAFIAVGSIRHFHIKDGGKDMRYFVREFMGNGFSELHE